MSLPGTKDVLKYNFHIEDEMDFNILVHVVLLLRSLERSACVGPKQ